MAKDNTLREAKKKKTTACKFLFILRSTTAHWPKLINAPIIAHPSTTPTKFYIPKLLHVPINSIYIVTSSAIVVSIFKSRVKGVSVWYRKIDKPMSRLDKKYSSHALPLHKSYIAQKVPKIPITIMTKPYIQ
jgi:hypothetical protein